MSNFFVISHQQPDWKIPFDHKLVGVGGFSPKGGFAARDVISHALDNETALGALRAVPLIAEEIKKLRVDEPVFVSSYRVFLGKETTNDWLSPILQEFQIVSPEKFEADHDTLVMKEVPSGVDIVIPSPRLLPDTILGQYSRLPGHHLDDLLFGVGCAIRAGLLNGLLVPKLLSSNVFIAYNGIFASSAKFRLDYYDRLWWAVNEFYKHYYLPRFGYERRVIDFVFERVTSMALMQLIVDQKLSCLSARVTLVSETGQYVAST